MIYNKKGDKAICGSSRAFSLLSVAGKLLDGVMLIRLPTYVIDTVVPESQCSFRRWRSTTDMIVVVRILQEKCRQQHRDLLLPSSSLQTLSTPSIVICCGEAWANMDALHIFIAPYGNSILIWVPASGREGKCRRIFVWTQELRPSTCYFQPLLCGSESRLSSQHLCCRWRSHQVQVRWKLVWISAVCKQWIK